MNTVIHIYVYIYEFIYTDVCVCVYMIWTCRFLPLAKMKSQGLNSLLLKTTKGEEEGTKYVN